MRTKFFLGILFFVGISNYAQNTGINIQNPLGMFQVDGLGNDGTGSPSAANQVDDFIVTTGGNVGIGTAYPTSKLEVKGGLKVSDLREQNLDADKVVTVATNGAFKKVDQKTFIENVDQTINFRGVYNNNITVDLTGDEDFVWMAGYGGTVNFAVPTAAQKKRGKVIYIVSSLSLVKFTGAPLPTLYNGVVIKGLTLGQRIGILPVVGLTGPTSGVWYIVSFDRAGAPPVFE